MERIKEYAIQAIEGKQTIYLPQGSKIFSVVKMHEANVAMFAIVDDAELETQPFTVQAVRTNSAVDFVLYSFIGTLMFAAGSYALHYFVVSDIDLDRLAGDVSVLKAEESFS